MIEHSSTSPDRAEIYDANAEYYDLITSERVAAVAPLLDAFTARLDPGTAPLVDIGAGTGRLTAHLARLVRPREVIALEPSRAMRSVLASRVAGDQALVHQVTLVPFDLDSATDHLPEHLGGAIAFGVLPHLDPAGRRHLLTELARRLDGRALIEVMPPWTADPVPTTPMASLTAGRHRIECAMRADRLGDDRLAWTMTYRRVDERGTLLHEAVGTSHCWVVDPATFTSEARAAGFEVDWPTDDVAELHRSNA